MQDLELKNAIEVLEKHLENYKLARSSTDPKEDIFREDKEALQIAISTAQEYQELRQAMLSAKMPEKKKYIGTSHLYSAKIDGYSQAWDDFQPYVARLEAERDMYFNSDCDRQTIIEKLELRVNELEGEKKELEEVAREDAGIKYRMKSHIELLAIRVKELETILSAWHKAF